LVISETERAPSALFGIACTSVSFASQPCERSVMECGGSTPLSTGRLGGLPHFPRRDASLHSSRYHAKKNPSVPQPPPSPAKPRRGAADKAASSRRTP